jgi:diaminohydroxyphosphoribosylaminopyrimidine deaminase/5-amino-6-(5-phosphoribosylamino)uracil reductase
VEVRALKTCKPRQRRAGCTAYVAAEPCHHHENVPCRALLAAGIGRVVAAMSDPDPIAPEGPSV